MKQVLAVVALLSVVLITAGLGRWQLNRADYKRHMHLRQLAAQNADPIALGGPGSAAVADVASPDGKAITVTGEWQPQHTVFIDNRTYQGVAGFHVISALKVWLPSSANAESALFVPVLRGWVAANRRNRNLLPAVRHPQGPVSIRGIATSRLDQALQLGDDTPPGAGDRLWQYFDLPKYRRWSGLGIHSFVLRQTSVADDGLVRDWPKPGNDVQRHNGYAFQWFAMSFCAASFLIWLIIRTVRDRFARRDGQRE